MTVVCCFYDSRKPQLHLYVIFEDVTIKQRAIE